MNHVHWIKLAGR